MTAAPPRSTAVGPCQEHTFHACLGPRFLLSPTLCPLKVCYSRRYDFVRCSSLLSHLCPRRTLNLLYTLRHLYYRYFVRLSPMPQSCGALSTLKVYYAVAQCSHRGLGQAQTVWNSGALRTFEYWLSALWRNKCSVLGNAPSISFQGVHLLAPPCFAPRF